MFQLEEPIFRALTSHKIVEDRAKQLCDGDENGFKIRAPCERNIYLYTDVCMISFATAEKHFIDQSYILRTPPFSNPQLSNQFSP